MIKKIVILALMLIPSCRMAFATQIVYPTIWGTNDTVTNVKLNNNNNAVSNVVNGNIDNTNTAPGYSLFQVVAGLPPAGTQGRVDFVTANNTLNLDTGSAWITTITPNGALSTGNIPYYNGAWQQLSPGAQGLPLVSNGVSSLPSYQMLPAQGIVGGSTTQGSILFASTSSVLTSLPPGTAGQFLQTQGAGANPQWVSTPFVPNNMQVFVSSGTWTKPANVTQVYVKDIGGGGAGGAGVNSASLGGGGGGAGGYAEGIVGVTGNVTVTIGSTNSFAGTTTIQATTGSTGSTASSGLGGAGGAGSNGTINLTGAAGFNSVSQTGGNGGNSIMGAGGSGQSGSTNGTAGSAYGGGGGGGGSTSGNHGTGGAGDVGAVIVYY